MNTVFVINIVFLVVFPVFLISCLVIYLFIASGVGTGQYFRNNCCIQTEVPFQVGSPARISVY